MKKFGNIHEAYAGVLSDVCYDWEFETAPRGLPIKEVTDYMFEVNKPIVEPVVTADNDRNRVIARYTKKEIELYDSCSNKVEDFARASKFWNHIANSDGTVNSAYGYLIWKKQSLGNKKFGGSPMTPWTWCVNSLKADKDTRQAILRFSLPEHHFPNNKDFVCTSHANFLIRDNKLSITVVMRSNDIVKGLIYDMVWFISLIDKMKEELKDVYPDLQTGTYRHLSHSMHMYTKDTEVVEGMLG